ncbi:protocadherin gamma-B2-like [Lycorma delicatula]|uniref:protocadherin gamma-B2-like n=1 Tax=Lycorma delicatula TaxID=130591 RepID=UPI003F50EB1F
MVVSDDDVGDNARFTLTLQSEDERVHRWFRVEPTSGQGRTPVVIRVNDNTDLDYDAGLRSARLAIIASIQDADGEMQQVASSGVKINILDSNDNSPIFNETSYSFTIPEDLQPGSLIANVSATDKDSGEFGKITYSLRGFGMDKFGTNLKHGNLYLLGSVPPLHGSVSVYVRVGVSGNQRPVFRGSPYNVSIPENLPPDSPVVAVRATDPDGPDNQVEYRIGTGADNFYINNTWLG